MKKWIFFLFFVSALNNAMTPGPQEENPIFTIQQILAGNRPPFLLPTAYQKLLHFFDHSDLSLKHYYAEALGMFLIQFSHLLYQNQQQIINAQLLGIDYLCTAAKLESSFALSHLESLAQNPFESALQKSAQQKLNHMYTMYVQQWRWDPQAQKFVMYLRHKEHFDTSDDARDYLCHIANAINLNLFPRQHPGAPPYNMQVMLRHFLNDPGPDDAMEEEYRNPSSYSSQHSPSSSATLSPGAIPYSHL